jgi:hypothetical protein
MPKIDANPMPSIGNTPVNRCAGCFAGTLVAWKITMPRVKPRRAGAGKRRSKAPLPLSERTDDAVKRLRRYLADALAVEQEQIDQMQNGADTIAGADLRELLILLRTESHQRRQELEEQLRQIGGKAESGRGLVGHLAKRLIDAIRRPTDETDRSLYVLFRTLCGGELTASLYEAAEVLARSLGDRRTRDLAARCRRQVRDGLDRTHTLLRTLAGQAARRMARATAESRAG